MKWKRIGCYYKDKNIVDKREAMRYSINRKRGFMRQLTIRQAIETKYMGPTNYRGSRIKASCEAGAITIGWDDSLNSDDNHIKAANALMTKLNWHTYNKIVAMGSLKYVNIFILGEL